MSCKTIGYTVRSIHRSRESVVGIRVELLLRSTGILRSSNFRSTLLAKALRIVQAFIPELAWLITTTLVCRMYTLVPQVSIPCCALFLFYSHESLLQNCGKRQSLCLFAALLFSRPLSGRPSVSLDLDSLVPLLSPLRLSRSPQSSHFPSQKSLSVLPPSINVSSQESTTDRGDKEREREETEQEEIYSRGGKIPRS